MFSKNMTKIVQFSLIIFLTASTTILADQIERTAPADLVEVSAEQTYSFAGFRSNNQTNDEAAQDSLDRDVKMMLRDLVTVTF
ncbi:MAG: hypothetical protein QNK37_19580 [Acidobacteriota bacterium]|nr:hypothetical protein [Acidobacteriota bacterium]